MDLLNIDCFKYMRDCADNAFDICITSPPYNMNLRVNAKGDGYCSRQIVKELSTKYENYDDNLPMDDYCEFLSDFIKESTRVSKLVFLNIQQITGNKPAIFKAIGENSRLLKETIIWDKMVAQPSIADRVLNSQFEYIFVFGDNPIARQFTHTNLPKGLASNVWRIKPTVRNNESHGASFPLELPETILAFYAKTGDKVFDPFLGTGTTAIAAHYAKCDFFGCEIDQNYYDAACERIDRETRQMDLLDA